jgi:zinc-finger of transposase IS204/IS1001/IS1096/IS1165
VSLSQVSGCLSCQHGISFEVLLPHLATVIAEKAELAGNCLWLWAHARADGAACPRCSCSSGQVHSTYRRRLADAAIGGRRVRIRLGVRRFFCGNPDCPAVTFAEQVDGLTFRRSGGPRRRRGRWPRLRWPWLAAPGGGWPARWALRQAGPACCGWSSRSPTRTPAP